MAAATGQQCGEPSDAHVDDVRRQLTAAMPSPTGRAVVLLSWLGRLSVPVKALWGEGVLVRKLLADLALPDIAAAAAETRTGHAAAGVVNLVMHSGDDGTLARAIGPALRQLFPPASVPQPASSAGPWRKRERVGRPAWPVTYSRTTRPACALPEPSKPVAVVRAGDKAPLVMGSLARDGGCAA